ncbi:DAO domain-containing protein [Fusarium keratoplasticum]|nr:DAO domain-containing protein [Fusarium keratoplasticum]
MDTAQHPKRRIVVIGAGIIGLTCALSIQSKLAEEHLEHRYLVMMVSRDFPTCTPGAPTSHAVDYASVWAGAHVRPIPASTPQLAREATWLEQTVQHLRGQAEREPWIGITPVTGVEYLEAPDEAYQTWISGSFEAETGLTGFQELPASALPPGVVLGFEYQTFCLNAPVYCTGLLRKFLLQGGHALRRNLASEWEGFSVAPDVAAVINASGVGFGDPKCFPTRGTQFYPESWGPFHKSAYLIQFCTDSESTGQIVLTNFTGFSKTITRQCKDGSWSFVIPRFFDGGTIIGGTKEPNNWETEPHLDTREELMEAAKGLDPGLAASLEGYKGDKSPHVIADVVGRRPTRDGGMRLQVERNSSLGEEVRGVVHAYGAGGRGYELSWGVAQEVTSLVMEELNRSNGAKIRPFKL